jgi:hypothetical protein
MNDCPSDSLYLRPGDDGVLVVRSRVRPWPEAKEVEVDDWSVILLTRKVLEKGRSGVDLRHSFDERRNWCAGSNSRWEFLCQTGLSCKPAVVPCVSSRPYCAQSGTAVQFWHFLFRGGAGIDQAGSPVRNSRIASLTGWGLVRFAACAPLTLTTPSQPGSDSAICSASSMLSPVSSVP